MKYIKRNSCAIDGSKTLENLYTLNKFPIFMGAIDKVSAEKDILGTLKFDICKTCGSVQLGKLAPLDLVYRDQHNDGVGIVWQRHYQEFSLFVKKYYAGRILEIGGAIGTVAKIFTETYHYHDWTIVEPNPTFLGNRSIKVLKGWFDDKFLSRHRYQTIVHSHVFEHTYNPKKFLEDIARNLRSGDRHIFSFPNMEKQLDSKYTNCLNFEHTVFLPENMVDIMLARAGFRILEKKYFNDHSIFYATVKDVPVSTSFNKGSYLKYKHMFTEFVNYHLALVSRLNKQSSEYHGEIYLFGAHIFSQYLISFGLKTKKIISILDNSTLKIGKRLYGTNLNIFSPEVIKDKNTVAVIVKVAGYRDEIIKQLSEINPNVEIWE